ncbi:alpha/beta fold hydrolase [Deinococcus yavapaiensis]|uniref:Pimeloyl-ACP methyl ester carboxylesterase n=1 Tax=Deinococcus yavapaiensis KR-236 TaxID=694435 RepID=A0A318SKV1_9DEIO|nr:alpha/beta hydrolase [Deinococcus yavapaiensis]PYE53155.1 pimeloyl-ACP methyl ester carboxylesterase [Deinococcus yavapaiensis KR-236]
MSLFTGFAKNGLPYAKLSESGPPLVFLTGSELQHRPPTRAVQQGYRFMLRRTLMAYSVYLCSRKPGLPLGTTARDMSDDFAFMIESEIGQPAHIVGMSSGGSSAMHLAADHPHLVDKLVLAMTGYRLNSHGMDVGRVWRDLALEGDWPKLWIRMSIDVAEGRTPAWLLGPVMRLLGPKVLGVPSSNGQDLAVVMAADLDLDVADQLPRITAPTLVIGGEQDPFYGAENIRETAARIANARLVLLPGGHAVVKSKPRAFEEAVLTFLSESARAVPATSSPRPLASN